MSGQSTAARKLEPTAQNATTQPSDDKLANDLAAHRQKLNEIANATRDTAELLRAIHVTLKRGPDFFKKYIWQLVGGLTLALISYYSAEILSALRGVGAMTDNWFLANYHMHIVDLLDWAIDKIEDLLLRLP